jgi:hypothetical protein
MAGPDLRYQEKGADRELEERGSDLGPFLRVPVRSGNLLPRVFRRIVNELNVEAGGGLED